MSDHISIDPVMQKDATDCAVAALAMLLGHGYSDVRAVCPKNLDDGMTNRQMIAAAKKLGRVLVYHPAKGEEGQRFFVGIIKLERSVQDKPRTKEYHVGLFFHGVIINPADGLVWEREGFFQMRRWKPIGIFVDVTPTTEG